MQVNNITLLHLKIRKMLCYLLHKKDGFALIMTRTAETVSQMPCVVSAVHEHGCGYLLQHWRFPSTSSRSDPSRVRLRWRAFPSGSPWGRLGGRRCRGRSRPRWLVFPASAADSPPDIHQHRLRSLLAAVLDAWRGDACAHHLPRLSAKTVVPYDARIEVCWLLCSALWCTAMLRMQMRFTST